MAMMDIQIDTELASVIDQTAMILVSMKNDPTPPSSPVPSALSPRHHLSHALRAGSPNTIHPHKTESCECMLCTRNAPIILSKCHTWAWIMRVVFYSLRERYPEKKFFSLKNDVYEYMMNHWNVLGLDRKPSANWHKQIQDMLSHSRNIFESGMTHFKQNGFWRLKDLEDPWTARPDTPRPPSTTPPLIPTLIPSSPRKRVWKNTLSEEEDEEDVQATLKKLCTPPTSPRLSLHVHEALSSPSSSSSLSSACSSRPSSPLSESTSTPPFYNPLSSSSSSLKASEEMEREVAILREQLNHMTAQLSESPSSSPSPSPTPSSSCSPSPSPSPTPTTQFIPAVFSHNRVWEEAAPLYSYQQFPSVQA